MDAGNWIALAALALGFIGSLLGLLWYLTQQIAQERQWREEADRKITADFADYKLYVAQNHVTSQALRETEERLVTAFDRVATRLETIVARLDRLALGMARSGAVSDS